MDDELADRATAAHHEAGHAVAAVCLRWTVHSTEVYQFMLDWRGETPADAPNGPDLRAAIVLTLAGVFAESRYRGSSDLVSSGCLEEFQEAEDEARTDGLDFEELQREAKALLDREWKAVTTLASLLTGEELRIEGAQAAQVIREHLSSGDASLT